MLINDFFEITGVHEKENSSEYTVKLNADHRIYGGHFPGNPVTPGVVQLQMVKELLETKYGQSYQLATISRCKYLKVLNPVETPEITIQIAFSPSSAQQAPAINATGQKGEQVFFKFSATYR